MLIACNNQKVTLKQAIGLGNYTELVNHFIKMSNAHFDEMIKLFNLVITQESNSCISVTEVDPDDYK